MPPSFYPGPLKRDLYRLYVRFLQTGESPTYDQLVAGGFYGECHQNVRHTHAEAEYLFKTIGLRIRLCRKLANTLECVATGKVMVPFEDFVAAVLNVHTRGGLSGPGHMGTNKSIIEVKKMYSVGEKNFGLSEAHVRRIIIDCPDESCIRKIWLTKLVTGVWPESKPLYYQDRSLINFKKSKGKPDELPESGSSKLEPIDEPSGSGTCISDPIDLTKEVDEPLDLSVRVKKSPSKGSPLKRFPEPNKNIRKGPYVEEYMIGKEFKMGHFQMTGSKSKKKTKTDPPAKANSNTQGEAYIQFYKVPESGHLNEFELGRVNYVSWPSEASKTDETHAKDNLNNVPTKGLTQEAFSVPPLPKISHALDSEKYVSVSGEESTQGTKAKWRKLTHTEKNILPAERIVGNVGKHEVPPKSQHFSKEQDLQDIGVFLQKQTVPFVGQNIFQTDKDVSNHSSLKIASTLTQERWLDMHDEREKEAAANQEDAHVEKESEKKSSPVITQEAKEVSKLSMRIRVNQELYKILNTALEKQRNIVKRQLLQHTKKATDSNPASLQNKPLKNSLNDFVTVETVDVCKEQPGESLPEVHQKDKQVPKKYMLEVPRHQRALEVRRKLDLRPQVSACDEENEQNPTEIPSAVQHLKNSQEVDVIKISDSPPNSPPTKPQPAQTPLAQVPCLVMQNETSPIAHQTGDGVAQKALGNVTSIVRSMRQDVWILMADNREDVQKQLNDKINDALQEVKRGQAYLTHFADTK